MLKLDAIFGEKDIYIMNYGRKIPSTYLKDPQQEDGVFLREILAEIEYLQNVLHDDNTNYEANLKLLVDLEERVQQLFKPSMELKTITNHLIICSAVSRNILF